VKANDGCACGRAIRLRHPIFIEDVVSDDEYVPYRQAAIGAGYRSVLSLPLITAAGRLVGVMSVHHSTPQEPIVEMARLNNLAEFASGAVARHCYLYQFRSMQQISDDIRVTVEGNAIVVHKPGTTFMVAYEKRPDNAHITLVRLSQRPHHPLFLRFAIEPFK
jgi:GAF domain-containing protein